MSVETWRSITGDDLLNLEDRLFPFDSLTIEIIRPEMPKAPQISGDSSEFGNAQTVAERRRWRAPRGDGELLSVPDLSAADQLSQQNAMTFHQRAVTTLIGGVSLAILRQQARLELFRIAQEYTASLTGGGAPQRNNVDPTTSRWFMTGHQPELFHPGVWVKNFAIGGLAQSANHSQSSAASSTAKTGAISMNLIVDNDLHTHATLRAPSGPVASASWKTFSYDARTPTQPWEDRVVVDESAFRRFGDDVSAEMTSQWGYRPLLADCWADAVAHLSTSRRIADCFVAMRHKQEQRWGINNLELPLSRLCESTSYRQFASHLLLHAEHFARDHNAALNDYRQRHHIRSKAHPVAALEFREGWTEAPFWVWRAGETVRQRLFVRQTETQLELSNDDTLLTAVTLPARISPAAQRDSRCRDDASCRSQTDVDANAELSANSVIGIGLEELARQGWRLRTRALTTTLFARLCLADLFIHGIGGARYDEMTDSITQRFFQFPLPPYLTLTATRHLPLPQLSASTDDPPRLRHELRSVQFHGEQFLPPNAELTLRQRQQQLLDRWHQDHRDRRAGNQSLLTSAERHNLHRELRLLQQQFATLAAPASARICQTLQEVEGKLQSNSVLNSREFAWPLFTSDRLEPFAQQLQQAVSRSMEAV
ncbi:MAG: hypothetical protein R3C01_15935 [Planctomycetaceae bacterium]